MGPLKASCSWWKAKHVFLSANDHHCSQIVHDHHSSERIHMLRACQSRCQIQNRWRPESSEPIIVCLSLCASSVPLPAARDLNLKCGADFCPCRVDLSACLGLERTYFSTTAHPSPSQKTHILILSREFTAPRLNNERDAALEGNEKTIPLVVCAETWTSLLFRSASSRAYRAAQNVASYKQQQLRENCLVGFKGKIYMRRLLVDKLNGRHKVIAKKEGNKTEWAHNGV